MLSALTLNALVKACLVTDMTALCKIALKSFEQLPHM